MHSLFHRYLILLFILCFGLQIGAQKAKVVDYIYHLKKTDHQITIDGLIDESSWTTAQIASDFTLNAPIDNAPPAKNTEVKMLCDQENIYLLAVCYDDMNYVIQTLKRDGFGNSDEFAILIDPVGNKASGYGFGVNAMGAQTEVIISPKNVDFTWDNRWYSSVSRHDDRWIVEMKIPLKSIRYKENIKEWRDNFSRKES